MLYRVRRRGEDQDRELVAMFHELQDKLTYYQAWIGSESIFMSRSYARLVVEIKSKTEVLIREAWEQPVRVAPGDAESGDKHPDVTAEVDTFLHDVRSHLSPFFWRRIALAWRNREEDG